MAFSGNRYLVTFNESNSASVHKIEVFAADESDAKKKVGILYPNAQNVVVSSI